MVETRINEKKMVKRSVAIALGIACFVLAAVLAQAFVYYLPIISDRDNTISSLTLQNGALKSQVSNLSDIIRLSDFQVLNTTYDVFIAPHSYWIAPATSLPYAGYVEVYCSSTSTIWAELIYSISNGFNFDNKVVLENGWAYFPVLPSSNIQIRIGANSSNMTRLYTVELTYYY